MERASKAEEISFFGREWLYTKLVHYMDGQRPASGGVLIVGGPGSGKTSVCQRMASSESATTCHNAITPCHNSPSAKLQELSTRIGAVHFCRQFEAATVEAATLIRSLAEQLAVYPPIASQLSNSFNGEQVKNALETTFAQNYPKQAITEAIIEPLARIDTPPAKSLCIVVDALDEANFADDEAPNFCELMQHLAAGLPSWVLLLCTARRDCRQVMHRLPTFKKVVLDDLRRSYVVRDVQQYILKRLDTDRRLRRQLDPETAELLNQLHVKSAGCFLYLRLVLDGASSGLVRLREVQHIPGTLNGLYLWLCQRVFSGPTNYAFFKIYFEVLLASRERILESHLYEAIKSREPALTQSEHQEHLKKLALFLNVYQGKVHIFHSSFHDWLLDVKHCTRRFLCSLEEGHAALTLRLAERGPELQSAEVILLAYHLMSCPDRPPFRSEHRVDFLKDHNVPVSDLVLKCPVVNEATTRLLLAAGADFEQTIEDQICPIAELSSDDDSRAKSSSLNSSSDHDVVIIDETPDDDGRTELHRLCSQRKVEAIAELLAKGAYCDPEDKSGDTPLNVSAKYGNLFICSLLVEHGADVDHVGNDGWTPLRSAAWCAHVDVVDMIISSGATVDACSSSGRTALRAGAWGGHEDVVTRLLTAGANANQADADGRTPLMAAAYMGHRTVVNMLLDRGHALANHLDNDKRSALHIAAVCAPVQDCGDHLGVVRALITHGGDVHLRDSIGRTPLHYAALEGRTATCDELLNAGADVDEADSRHMTPLLTAASGGHVETALLLLKYGAHADAVDEDGRTVLTVAASQGCPELVQALLDAGVDECHRDNFGWLPLHHASFEGRAEACKLLCQRNANTVHMVDHDGRHPLTLAAEEGHHATATVLLEHGAQVDKPILDGSTALRISAVSGYFDVVQLLLRFGADLNMSDLDGNSTIYALILQRQVELAEKLLCLGASADTADSHGRSPLHVCAWHNDRPAAALLVSFGARVDLRDNDGRTPLMTAVWRNATDVVDFLLRNGADPNVTTNEGATALGVAAQEGRIVAAKLLLRYGANVDHTDSLGRKPADMAASMGHSALLDALLQPVGTHRTTDSGVMMASSSNSGGRSPSSKVAEDDGRILTNGTHRSSGHSSNKSTLSSTCGSPDSADDFQRQLIERSLPRRHSLVFTACPLAAVEIDPCPVVRMTAVSPPSISEDSLKSVCSIERQRSRILTNPKCRRSIAKERSPLEETKNIVVKMRESKI